VLRNTSTKKETLTEYNQDEQDMPESTYDEGETVTLEPTDESPFLGDIAPGTTVRY